jgi:hypothetical protein
MTTDASNLAEHVPTPPIEGRVASPSNDPVAASLRGFGPLGLRDSELQTFKHLFEGQVLHC